MISVERSMTKSNTRFAPKNSRVANVFLLTNILSTNDRQQWQSRSTDAYENQARLWFSQEPRKRNYYTYRKALWTSSFLSMIVWFTNDYSIIVHKQIIKLVGCKNLSQFCQSPFWISKHFGSVLVKSIWSGTVIRPPSLTPNWRKPVPVQS